MKNSTKKNLSTLVEDIYQTVTDITDGKRKIPDELVDELGQKIARTIKTWATPQNHNKFKLRMSNIGRPARQLYYSQKDNREIRHHPSTQMKFLYGHIMEDLLIFKNGTLRDDDPFGYISQLAGYERAEGTENGGFLAMNKESGEIALYQPDDLDKPNIKTLIGKLLDVLLNLGKPPEKCYKPVPAGIKGNMKLPIGCVYCSHKIECNKDTNDGQGLRMFKYAKGITYLTKVVSTPNVEEITNAKTYH
jgi:plasmid maintenance system antidote protein VapI